MNITAGAVFPTKYFRIMLDNKGSQAGFKPQAGRRFVLLFLGDEGADGSDPLDPIKALHELGWQRISDKERSNGKIQS